MWNDLTDMGVSVWDKGIRTVVVFLFIAFMLRVFGRRDLAQFTTFDLVVVLLLSNVVQNAIIGPDNSLTGGLVGAAMLFVVNALVVRAGSVSDRVEKAFEGSPVTLADDGALDRGTLRRLGLRPRDVDAAMREQGATSVADVKHAELMPSGTLLVELHDSAQAATRGDVQRLLDRIAALEAALTDRRPPAPGAA
jgi:uncharacterized membrane protein YcaP (DUF421 family)